MNARRLLLALCLLPCLALLAHAQPVRRITTGASPSFLIADQAHGQVHAITAGVDRNFNGILELDSGDIAPKWFVIDAVTEHVIDSAIFDGFFSSIPIRPGFDLQGGRLYVAQLGRVRAYDLNTRKLVRDSIAMGNFAAVTFDQSSHMLALSERTEFPEPDYVLFVDTTGVPQARVLAGIGPSMMGTRQGENGVEQYVMNEGLFGAGNSSLSYSMMRPDAYSGANAKALGGGGNYVATMGDIAFVALGGGQKIHMIDTRTHLDLPFSPIVVGPTGPNGPRTLAFQGDSLLLAGIWDGRLLRIRIANGTVVDSILVPGRIESIAVRDSLAFVATRNALNAQNKVGDSSIFVVNLNTARLIDTIAVRRAPGTVFIAANGDVHVICYGGADTVRWWMSFDGATLAPKNAVSFKGALGDPLRTYYNPAIDSLYIVVADSLRACSATAQNPHGRLLYNPAFDSTMLTGVSSAGDGYLFTYEAGPLTLTPGPEYLHLLATNGDVVAKFKTGPRPSIATRVHSPRESALSFYVLDRGVPQAQTSHLDFFELKRDILAPDTLGNGANHLHPGEGGAVVTMNGGHEIVGVNFVQWAVNKRVSTHTTGFDGPRESILLSGNRLLVTTYAGDVRVITPDGTYGINPIGGKAEGITVVGDKVFVASVYAPDYSPDSVVVVLDAASLVSSVERVEMVALSTSLEQNRPNPVVDATTIGFAVQVPQHVTLTLYTASGEVVETLIDKEMEAGTYNAELRTSRLPSGSYIYTLRTGSSLLSKVMTVVR